MMRVGVQTTAINTGRLWRIAVLAAAGAVGSVSQAEAALYYWSDSDAGYYRPGPTPRRQKPHHHHASKKITAPEKESAKPQGPLIIAISIEKQTVKIYDDKGFFAEAPVSTGMKGHPTPMGVFSIIQKHKLHHSNIYSGAPMPYMQRITWSGVAMHAGVLPGYPASHGCIRMPTAFAIKMWNWTKMGARVVITPGEIRPTSFSHPLLVAQKVVPQPAAPEPRADTPPAAKSDKASDAGAADKPAISVANLELRSTVGHGAGATPEQSASPSLRDRTRTADASGDMPANYSPATMSDAAPSGGNNTLPPAAARADNTPANPADAVSAKADDASKPEAKPEGTEPEVAKSLAGPAAATATSDDKAAVETKLPDSVTAETTPAESGTTGEAIENPDQAAATPRPGPDAAKIEASTIEALKAEDKAEDIKPDDAKAESPKPTAAQSGEKPGDKPADTVKAVTATSASAPDAKKDEVRLPDTAKPAAAAAPKRTGQIAAFISRKDSKLYVRQNFAPLFEVPVVIAPSDRPLGTHVFTAEIDKGDANLVHWSVVSLPVPARYAERRDDDGRATRRRKIAGAAAVEPKPLPVPDSPAEALDRITVPADAMARITDALTTGGSIIVSDQGINAGETGEGTDFIVSLR
jgi:lipoprotein-anchoring transpeptidase ErfK/SrfK